MEIFFSLLSAANHFYAHFGFAGIVLLGIVLGFGIPAVRCAWRGGR